LTPFARDGVVLSSVAAREVTAWVRHIDGQLDLLPVTQGLSGAIVGFDIVARSAVRRSRFGNGFGGAPRVLVT
jgi:hypothetical protein